MLSLPDAYYFLLKIYCNCNINHLIRSDNILIIIILITNN